MGLTVKGLWLGLAACAALAGPLRLCAEAEYLAPPGIGWEIDVPDGFAMDKSGPVRGFMRKPGLPGGFFLFTLPDKFDSFPLPKPGQIEGRGQKSEWRIDTVETLTVNGRKAVLLTGLRTKAREKTLMLVIDDSSRLIGVNFLAKADGFDEGRLPGIRAALLSARPSAAGADLADSLPFTTGPLGSFRLITSVVGMVAFFTDGPAVEGPALAAQPQLLVLISEDPARKTGMTLAELEEQEPATGLLRTALSRYAADAIAMPPVRRRLGTRDVLERGFTRPPAAAGGPARQGFLLARPQGQKLMIMVLEWPEGQAGYPDKGIAVLEGIDFR
jgi:hypothetical protein